MKKILLMASMCVFSIATFAQLNCNNVNAAISLSASGATATLTNSSVPTSTSTIYTYYQINWGDNSTMTYVYNSNAAQQHAYTASGTYTVTLYSNVLDSINNINCYDTATANISVTVPPLNCNNVNATMTLNLVSGVTGRVYNYSTPTGGLNLSTQYTIKWGDGNTTNTSSKSMQSHTYTNNGTYTVWLISAVHDSTNNITCVDSTSGNVTVTNSGFNCNNVNAAYTKTVSAPSVTTYNQSMPNVGSGTTATYTYFWGDGNSTTKTNKSNTTHTYASNGSYTIKLRAVYVNGTTTCVDSTSDTVFIQTNNPPPANIISGIVWVDSTSTLDSYKVWLIKFDSTNNILSAVDSMAASVMAGSGSYWFNNKAAGTYRTKAARMNGPTSGIGHVPTYHDSSLLWSSATVINHTGGSSLNKHIYMKKGTLTAGPGFVGGNVSQGANKGTGSGIPNLNILLLDGNNNVVTYAITDVNGDYSFPNLPLGTYKVHPELVGYTTAPATLDITNAVQSQTTINFTRSTSQKTITPLPQGISNVNDAKLAFVVYPNPASDVVTINWASFSDDAAVVTITDISGKKIMTAEVEMNSNATLNIDVLQTGFYFMNVATELGSNTQKLIIQ